MARSVVISSENECSEKDSFTERARVWPQVLACVIASLGAFTQGILFSWTSPFIVKIAQDKVNYNISEEEAARLPTIQPLTVLLTSLIFFKLPDIIGRKKTLLLISVPHILSLITAAVARSIYVFYLSRVFSGLANGFLWTALPMYIGEVTCPKIRGLCGTLITSAIFVGQLAVNVVGSYCDVATTSYIFIPVSILFVILFAFMPESPYYYLMKKDYGGARRSLIFLTRKRNVVDDLNNLKSDVDRQMSETGTWKDLVAIESNRNALFCAVFLRMSQSYSGISVFIQYTQYIFLKAGGNVTPQTASIIYSILCVVITLFVTLFVVSKFGRKPLYSNSSALCSVILAVMAAYFYLEEFVPTFDISSLSWLPITSLVTYQVCSCFGVAIIPSVMLGELFSASVKSKAVATMTFVNSGGIFLANATFNFLSSAGGSYAPFLFFSICTGITTVLTRFVVPETKDKTLEEIQMNLKRSA
ncbi:facilitated trehalose transporter Tret1-like [Diabrotica undecimpunctata]|uniref:facilitated trehalose transporter Tret1-like n=1 Tax=Diabrotica undecimpunctata TaxID=50387 RepID=UPI003B64240E